MTAELKYPRILLKVSGEALAGDKGFGYDFDAVGRFADEIVALIKTGASVGLVIGHVLSARSVGETQNERAQEFQLLPFKTVN